MGFLLWRAAGEKVSEQGLTDIRPAVAEILHKKQHHLPEALKIRVVDDGSAMSVASNKPCPCEDSQMRRHGVLRNLQKPGYFACGNSIGFSARQKAKRLQPGGLSESGEACDSLI
jgi:hypothetical protein